MTRPLCIQCNFNFAGISTKTEKGTTYRKKCDRCRRGKEKVDARREAKRLKKRPWTAFKKDHCEECGFKAVHPCQLSVDHIDGSKQNNDPLNYRTLCHNCHALKTMINRDWLNLNYRERYGQDILQQVSQKPSVGG